MRRITAALLILSIALLLPQDGHAKARKKQAPAENSKYASIIIDAASGEVISEQYPNRPLHPASLTKVMTLMLLFEALENGTVRLNDKIMISSHAAAQQPSKLGLSAGSSIKVEDAILAVVTKSANDIATAIGEHLAGSESRFALRMTRRAHDIGMSRTTFKNASGLHNPAQISSARDMATLARYIIIRYPNYYRYFGTKQFTYRGKTMTNHNRLMNTYPGMDGFKTGFINASGFNLIASAKRDGRRLIGVVFGGKSWKSRNDHMASLLNTAFVSAPGIRHAEAAPLPENLPEQAVPVVEIAKAQMPLPEAKPVFRTTGSAAPQGSTGQPPTNTGAVPGANYTSLSALDTGRRAVAPTVIVPATAEIDTTERAVASVKTAINRGDYSEVTGEGDYDAATTRRVETALLSAAVYKGDHHKVRELKAPSAPVQAQAKAPATGILQLPPGKENMAPVQAAPTQVALSAAQSLEQPSPSNTWSVQIGAYTSRVAADDALRIARSKLPSSLVHASPIVVPLKTGEGHLFRGRLGGFAKDEAVRACNYFRDCLPVAPR